MQTSSRSTMVWLACCFALAGCSGADSPCPDAGVPPQHEDLSRPADLASGKFPAYTPALVPQIKKNLGPVLANPKIVPIFFSGDPLVTQLVTFTKAFVSTSAVYQQLHEYGVGAGTVAAQVVLNETVPATIKDLGPDGVQAWLAQHINGGMLPMPDANTVYLVFYPYATTVTRGSPVQTGCTNFEGYHDDAPLSANQRVPYAVVLRCPQSTPDRVTTLVSHELAEAATDPFPSSAPAYDGIADPLGNWVSALGNEIGDLCEHLSDWNFVEPGVGTVQRIWSNAAARAFHNPCVPASGPYFVAIPVVSDMQGNRVGATIPPGQTRTIEVMLTSDAETPGPFVVTVPTYLIGSTLALGFAESGGRNSASGHNGDVLHLQVTNSASTVQNTRWYFQTTTSLATPPLTAQNLWITDLFE